MFFCDTVITHRHFTLFIRRRGQMCLMDSLYTVQCVRYMCYLYMCSLHMCSYINYNLVLDTGLKTRKKKREEKEKKLVAPRCIGCRG